MKWDGQAYSDYIKRGLFILLTYMEKEKAIVLSHNEFTTFFRNLHKGRTQPVPPGEIGEQSIVMRCLFDKIEFDFQRPLNNNGDRIIYMTWSMAVRHVRYWVIEENEEKQKLDETLSPVDTKSETEENKMTAAFNLGAMLNTPAAEDKIMKIPCEMLIPYHNHKFALYDGERLDDMVESIKTNGILIPIIVQPAEGGKYEILIGHNRWNAAKIAGLQTVPAFIKEGLSEEEAEMYVIESNLMQRGFDDLRISEQAAVIAIRHSKMFSQGKRTDIRYELERLNQISEPIDTNREIGEEYGMSRATIARLIRIDKLDEGLKSLVDEGTVSVRAAVNLSYLSTEAQVMLIKLARKHKVDIKKSELLREVEKNHPLTQLEILKILSGTKASPAPKPKTYKISGNTIDRFFAAGTKQQEIENIIERALTMYFGEQTTIEGDDGE